MKINKLISLLAAVTMLSTSVVSVNAAISNDGEYVTGTATKEELQAREPKVEINVTQLTTAEEVKNYTTKTFSENDGDVTKNDVYLLKAAMSDIGEVVNGLNENEKPTFTGIATFKVSFKVDYATDVTEEQNIKIATKSAQIKGGKTQFGQDSVEKVYNLLWSTSDNENPWPVYSDTIVSEQNPTMEMYGVIAIPKGIEATIKYHIIQTNYISATVNDGAITAVMTNPADVTIGAPAPADVKVTAIEITGEPADKIKVGDTGTLTATVTPADATNKAVTWSSSDPAVIKIAVSTGEWTAVGKGKATLTATAADGSGVTASTKEIKVKKLSNKSWNNDKGFVFTLTIEGGYDGESIKYGFTDGTNDFVGADGKTEFVSTPVKPENIETDADVSFDIVMNTAKQNITLKNPELIIK